jgi:putative oxidoreductase
MGLDLAIDFSGDPKMLRLCIDVLRPGGRMVIGAGEENPREMVPVSVSDFIRLEVSINGVRGSNISDQLAIVRLLAQGQIKPAVATVMNLSEIVKAHEMLASNAVNGRIVLEPWPARE